MATIMQQKSKSLGSYPYASVMTSITIALIALGVLLMLILGIINFAERVKENIEVQIMLDNGLENEQITQLRQLLSEKKYVRKFGGQADITFKHKDEAARELIRDLKEDFITLLGENPLRHSFFIRIKSEFCNKESLEQIKKEIEQVKGVFEVAYAQEFSEEVNQNVAMVSFVLSAFALFMMIIVVILIHNTIRLALFSQRFIIRTMQLVGATDSFIRRPFLLTAFWQGLLSGLIAFIIIYISLPYLNVGFIRLSEMYTPMQMLIIGGILIFLGVLLSVFSSFRAVNKYLSMNLDELY
ncbi:MAG: permease-like cell division protein FtsX [Raineya sp.]|nr:permease-like cell division protein FtsX [Raineya sp.]